MQRIDSFEQLGEIAEAAGAGLKKPIRVLVLITMIVMVQLRKAYSPQTEERYAECMKAGEIFPAIKGVFDLSVPKIFGFDGEHRLNAAKRNGQTHILMELMPGTERDAILSAAGVNDAHGLGRSDEDKRNAVTALLADSEWRCWSSTKIARISRTSIPFVEGLRQEGEGDSGAGKTGSSKPTKRKVERNGKVYEMTIPARQKKDPFESALAKIMKLVEAFDVEARQRLVDAVVEKLKNTVPQNTEQGDEDPKNEATQDEDPESGELSGDGEKGEFPAGEETPGEAAENREPTKEESAA